MFGILLLSRAPAVSGWAAGADEAGSDTEASERLRGASQSLTPRDRLGLADSAGSAMKNNSGASRYPSARGDEAAAVLSPTDT